MPRIPKGCCFVTLTVFYKRLRKKLRRLQKPVPIYLPLLHPGMKERVEMTMKYRSGSEGEKEQGLKRDG